MNIFSGVMKLAQLVILLFLASNVVGGYSAKFQEGAVKGGPGKNGIGLFGREKSLNHVLRRHRQNIQEDDDADNDTGDVSDGPEDDDEGNGDEGDGDEGNGDEDNGDEGNGDEGNGDEGNGDEGNGDEGNGDIGDGDEDNGDEGNGDEGNSDDDNGVEDNGQEDDGVEENGDEDDDDHSGHSNRIVGGTPAAYGEFPWQVTVNVLLSIGDGRTKVFDCGAVIINEFWILSAGHCFIGRSESEFILTVGNHYLSRKDSAEKDFTVERIIIHPKFNIKQNVADYDIVLLKINPSADGQGIQFNKYVQPARLPDVRTSFPEGTECVISGWGDTAEDGSESDVLLKTDSPIVNQQRCKEVYAGIGTIVTERTICSGNVKGGTGVCGGDSGGGLVCKIGGVYVLAGIISSGVPCARPDYVTMFSLVPKFIPWIRSNVQHYSSFPQSMMPTSV